MTRIVLASASPARRRTLQEAGVEPVIRVSSVDEEAAVRAAAERYGDLEPADVALLLARAKCEDVAALLSDGEDDGEVLSDGADSGDHDADAGDDVVLGCDSVLEFDGAAFGKPADAADATLRWRALRGSSGILHTGHWLIDVRAEGSGATVGAVASTKVTFADLSDDEIEAYVATGEPLAVAGGFTVDGLGGPFVTAIDGDYHNVVGLSLPLLRSLLADIGIVWPTLWTARPPL